MGKRKGTTTRALLLDRDGTLIVDVPYNGDPALVRPMPTVHRGLDLARDRGVALGIVSNQSGVGRGLLTAEEVHAVNRRVDQLLGPFDTIVYCPHAPIEGCTCRKPMPGLVWSAAATIGVPPGDCVLVGDIGADVEAAINAGARAILVPTPQTRREEIAAAPLVAPDFATAVRWAIDDTPDSRD